MLKDMEEGRERYGILRANGTQDPFGVGVDNSHFCGHSEPKLGKVWESRKVHTPIVAGLHKHIDATHGSNAEAYKEKAQNAYGSVRNGWHRSTAKTRL